MKLPKTLSTVLVVVLAEIVLAAAAFFIMIYSGACDVAATQPHYRATAWALSTTMDHSVRHHAAGIPVSQTYTSPDLAEGYEHFSEMCVTCHGAPGVMRSEIGQGLNPSAPDLSEAAGDWTASEIYWIVKNGIKMSGMPAFGPTHDDEKLWNITAFVKRLPGMSAPQYQEMGKASESAESSHPESEGMGGCCGQERGPSAAPAPAAKAGAYTCPMHPEVKADKPGKCPKCGMALVPAKESK